MIPATSSTKAKVKPITAMSAIFSSFPADGLDVAMAVVLKLTN